MILVISSKAAIKPNNYLLRFYNRSVINANSNSSRLDVDNCLFDNKLRHKINDLGRAQLVFAQKSASFCHSAACDEVTATALDRLSPEGASTITPTRL